MTNYLPIAFILISYLLGSIPIGLLIGKSLTNKDVRDYGSKKISTTNCIRVYGKKIGLLIFFLDIFKGMFMIILLNYILEPNQIYITPSYLPPIVYGICTCIGNKFSIFLKFRGGTTIASTIGIMLILTPLPTILSLIVLIIMYNKKNLYKGYFFQILTLIISTWILSYVGNNTSFFFQKPQLHLCIIYTIVGFYKILKKLKQDK